MAKVKRVGREAGFKDDSKFKLVVQFSVNAGVRVRVRFGVRFRVRFGIRFRVGSAVEPNSLEGGLS
jgi:hypothetical protein